MPTPTPNNRHLRTVRPTRPVRLICLIRPLRPCYFSTPYNAQNVEAVQSLCRVLNDARFNSMTDLIDAQGLRVYENEHILRAWDMVEGMREDFGGDQVYHEESANDESRKEVDVKENTDGGESTGEEVSAIDAHDAAEEVTTKMKYLDTIYNIKIMLTMDTDSLLTKLSYKQENLVSGQNQTHDQSDGEAVVSNGDENELGQSQCEEQDVECLYCDNDGVSDCVECGSKY